MENNNVDEEREPITPSTLKRYTTQLERKYTKNQQDRLSYPDDPERWIKSEVDLDDQIRLFSDLSTMPELFDEFIRLSGLRLLCDTLAHPNIDIFMTTISVLSELIDPEVIYKLSSAELLIKELESLKIHKLCVDGLYKINEENGDVDYEGVKNSLELLENLLELVPSALSDLSIDINFLSFLLKRLKDSKTLEYDSNRIHAAELLCILLQGSESLSVFGDKDGIDGIDEMLRIIAIFRKRNPDSIEEEELVENIFQCLSRLMLIESNQLRFGKIQGVELCIRLIRERRSTYRSAIKLLDYALLDCADNCRIFVDVTGLKSICSVLMRKGVSTKVGTVDERKEDEHVISIINSLCTHCSSTQLARVINKFVEHKYEKLERLIELHKKYNEKCKLMVNHMEKSENSVYNMVKVDKAEQQYLDKYEAGLSICQLIDSVMLKIYNMGNKNLSLCLLVLLHNKGVDIQDIYNNMSDYIDHLSDAAADIKNNTAKLLQNFLIGASETNLFT